MPQGTNPPKFSALHFGVIGLGVLVFVLLLFADKTNLNNDPEASVAANTEAAEPKAPETNGNALEVPRVSNPELAQKLSDVETEEDNERKVALLKEIVEGLQQEGLHADAADYAGRLAMLDQNADNYLVAGALHRFVSRMNSPEMDTTQLKFHSDEAIRYLEKAVEMDPGNEGALIELGLAYVRSPQPGNAMKGIMKLREVTEKNPENAEAAFHLGVFSFETNQFDKAVDRFRKVTEIEPDNLLAQYYLGLCLKNTGSREEFQKIMSEIAEQNKDTVLARQAGLQLQNN